MKYSGICPKCGSQDIMPKIPVIDQTDGPDKELMVRVREKPDALILKGDHDRVLHAWICAACGYTELYVDNPEGLFEAYKRALEHKRSRIK
jgi:predicted nucleic-acid-binding Zn-ribbon protein